MKKVRLFFSAATAVALAVIAISAPSFANDTALVTLYRQISGPDCVTTTACQDTETNFGLCDFTTYTTDGGTSCSNSVTSWKVQ